MILLFRKYILPLRIFFSTWIVLFIFQLLWPLKAIAELTSGPTQPEIYGHQPVDATDNVSLLTGAFNYSIPITSIPEYPMAIGYSTGGSADNESSCFGYGWNGFSGAIGRNLMGLPDDMNGARKNYTYTNQLMWDVSGSGTVSVGKAPLGVSATLTVGYNNYKGVYGAVGLGLSLGGKAALKGPLSKLTSKSSFGLGLNITNDSRARGLQGGWGLGYTLFDTKRASLLGFGVGGSFSSMGQVSASVNSLEGSFAFAGGSDVFSAVNSFSTSYLSQLPAVTPTTKGVGISITVPVSASVTISAAYSSFSSGEQNYNKSGYGYMYLADYNRSNRDHLADFTIEGEVPYETSFMNNPVYMQKDMFTANCQGLNGNMQFFSEEYAIVSRNYNRYNNWNLDNLISVTDRRETEAWFHTVKAARNMDFDFLKFIKGDGNVEGESDFDKTAFIEQELTEFYTGQDYKFNKDNNKVKTRLRFRGDLAGDYKIGANDYYDFNPLNIKMDHISGTGNDSRFVFLGYENDMPYYYPKLRNTSGVDINPNTTNAPIDKIKNATKIDYYTAAEVTSHITSGLISTNEESFYNHLEYTQTSSERTQLYSLPGARTPTQHNIITKLNNMLNTEGVSSSIADIRVHKNDGSTYIFNLPVYAKRSRSVSIIGNTSAGSNGGQAPKNTSSDYYTFDDGSEAVTRQKVDVEDQFVYPYAWLLTAVVGSDYIDFDDIPGPSDGDLGQWVKFRYVKVASDYRWRMPFDGLEHLPGALHSWEDDNYAVSTGLKEVYYLEGIESKNYTSKYTYYKRPDGGEAAGYMNGRAVNSQRNESATLTESMIGEDFLFAVSQIDLYKKNHKANISTSRTKSQSYSTGESYYGKRIKSTLFDYDFSTQGNVANNIKSYSSIQLPQDAPYISLQSGKLTLKNVQHVAYDNNGVANLLPSYDFGYNAGVTTNYDSDQKDMWGNYNAQAIISGTDNNRGYKYLNRYTELNKTQANINALAYNLNSVIMPSGGSVNVNYESGGYAYVQDKKAYVMRNIISISTINASSFAITMNVTDLAQDGKDLNEVLKVGDEIFAEVAYYRNGGSNNKSALYISTGKAKISSIGTRTGNSQQIILNGTNVFANGCENYMANESPEIAATQGVSFDENGKASALDAVANIVNNIGRMFDNESQDAKLAKIGNPCQDSKIYPSMSFIRTPVYKEKYTGNRVRSISFMDGFKYSSDVASGINDNTYTTNYFYDENGNGTGASSGVVTIEPGGGETTPIDMSNTRGAGFMPAASLMYSKVTIETGYSNTAATGKTSRPKGKTQYQFYTPKDENLRFRDNFKQAEPQPITSANGAFYLSGILAWLKVSFSLPIIGDVEISIPFILPLLLNWQREEYYRTGSYAYTDVSDMYGKIKSISTIDAKGVEQSKKSFNYYNKSDQITILDGTTSVSSNPFDATASTQSIGLPGRIDQIWGEAHYMKEAKFNLLLLYLDAQTKKNFAYTAMRYSYIPSIMKSEEEINKIDNSLSRTTYTKFDKYSGQPVETEILDASNSTSKIVRTTPAYWKNVDMGPLPYQNITSYNTFPTKLNKLTDIAGTDVYMGTTSDANQNLLSADVTKWEKITPTNVNVTFVDSYVQWPQYDANGRTISFDILSGTDIKNIYGNGTYTKSTRLNTSAAYLGGHRTQVVPVNTYSYQTVTADQKKGTFGRIAAFNFASSSQADPNWKLVNTNTLFDLELNPVESKNILNQYSSTHKGYNNDQVAHTATNASYYSHVVADAESQYTLQGSTSTRIDNTRLQLSNTKPVTTNCNSQQVLKTLSNTLLQNPQNKAWIVKLINTSVSPGICFFRAPVTIKHRDANGNVLNSVNRVFNFYKDYLNNVYILTERGESFKGFLEMIPSSTECQLLFDPNVITFTSGNGTQNNTNYDISVNVPVLCNNATKTYLIPIDEGCPPSTHSGTHVFEMKPGGVISYSVNKGSPIPDDQFVRQYTAQAWIHATSPGETYLKIQSNGISVNTPDIKYASNPTLQVGDWKLLSVNYTPPSDHTNLVVLLGNASQSGIAYVDDLVFVPTSATIKTQIYEHVFGRKVAELDDQGMATHYVYDARGRVSEIKKDIQLQGTGITVKKYLYNDQRKQ